jgi:hypothetical protein
MEVRFMGHVVSRNPEKLEDVKNWPPQTDKHQARSFLGLCMYYTSFIAGFALTRITDEKRTSSGPRKSCLPGIEVGTLYGTCPGLGRETYLELEKVA